MTTPQEATQTSTDRSPSEDLRTRMCRIIDEITTTRSDRAAALKKEFDALWKSLPPIGEPGEPTLH
jgi:hypothetical protein